VVGENDGRSALRRCLAALESDLEAEIGQGTRAEFGGTHTIASDAAVNFVDPINAGDALKGGLDERESG